VDPRDEKHAATDGVVYYVYGLLVVAVGYLLGWFINLQAERYVLGWLIHLRWVAGAVALAGMAVAGFGFLLQLRHFADRFGRARARGEARPDLPDTSGNERKPPPGST
jgi:hypothetical protein